MGIAYGVTTNFQATKGIVQDGLVLNLDAGVKESYSSGSIWKDLKGSHDLTLYNGVTLSKDRGGSLTFDGGDEYAKNSNSSPDYGLLSYSLNFWFRATETFVSGNNYYIIENRYSGVTSFFTHSFRRSGTNSNIGIGGAINRGTYYANNLPVTMLTSPNELNWNNFCITYDNSSHDVKYYTNGSYNGVWQPGNFGSTAGNNNSQYVVGNYYNPPSSTYNTEGIFGNMQVYNRALTAAEVSRNFNVMRHRFGI
jgi:hypothetical protein